jgi:hypothetical protein
MSTGSRRPNERLRSDCGGLRWDALDDHAALELGKHTHHLKHGLAGRRRGVDPLLLEAGVDAEALQFGEEADLGPAESARAIDRPSHNEIELAARGVLVHGVEARALIAALRARNAFVTVHRDDLIAPSEPPLAERASLGCRNLMCACRQGTELHVGGLYDLPDCSLVGPFEEGPGRYCSEAGTVRAPLPEEVNVHAPVSRKSKRHGESSAAGLVSDHEEPGPD